MPELVADPIRELSLTVVAGLAAVASVVASLTVIWVKVVRPSIRRIRAGWAKIEAATTLIEAQLQHNGGGSLLDRVARIDDTLTHGCPLFGESGVCPAGRMAGQTPLRD